jgi:hypothetical protein
MSKVSWEAVLEKLKELELKPESFLKMAERMAKKGKRAETSKEVLRSSWIYDCAWHVYHRVGTKDQKNKITKTKVIRNYVESQQYQDNYKTFFLKGWDELPSIKKSKFSGPQSKKRALVETHTSNIVKLLLKPEGKDLMAWLVISGGSFIEAPGSKIDYLKNLKKAMSNPKKRWDELSNIYGSEFGPMNDDELEKFKKEYPYEWVKGQWKKVD